MFPEASDSEGEELPAFPFLSQQPAATKNAIQPPGDAEVVVLSSSDSEGSPAPSPPCKKSNSPQQLTRAAAHQEMMVQLSSENEEEEEEEPIIPLAERLKRKLLATKPSTTGNSFTRILEKSTGDLVGCNKLHSSNELGQEPLPTKAETWKRAAPGTWELSDSDSEPASSEPKKQPLLQRPTCTSDVSVQKVSHQETEIGLQPFPLPASRTGRRHREALNQAALERRKERAAQKVQQEEERERKKALANVWKAQRPEQCLKHIQVVLDPGLLQLEGGGQVLTTLQAMECSCVIESQKVPCSITWRRKTRLAQSEEDDLTEEPNLLVLVPREEFLTMTHNSKQVGMEEPPETLQAFVANIIQKVPGKILALVVVELEKYFSSDKPKGQKKAVQSNSEAQEQGKQRNWSQKANPALKLSRVDVEEALVGLQLHTGVQVRILESWKELADFASMFTKAVAEAPFKRERDKTSFSFCLEGDWISGTKVDRSGKGLLQVWKRQIQQFNRVSLEVASAVVAQYPSPMLLMKAYQCASEQERYNLLQEIPVRRGDGVTATTRRVGPELSKRIYLQMTSHNPDLSLDATG